MNRIERIKTKLSSLTPKYINIIDQSQSHSDHFDNPANQEQTHLRLQIYADSLIGINKVEQHRIINNLIANEFDEGLHALSINILNEPITSDQV